MVYLSLLSIFIANTLYQHNIHRSHAASHHLALSSALKRASTVPCVKNVPMSMLGSHNE